jgi:hypothetical protein
VLSKSYVGNNEAFSHEGRDKMTAPGMPDITVTWDASFADGRLSEIEFYPPMKYEQARDRLGF